MIYFARFLIGVRTSERIRNDPLPPQRWEYSCSSECFHEQHEEVTNHNGYELLIQFIVNFDGVEKRKIH